MGTTEPTIDDTAVDDRSPVVGITNPHRVAVVERLGIAQRLINPRFDRIGWLIKSVLGADSGSATIVDATTMYWSDVIDEAAPAWSRSDPIERAMARFIVESGEPLILHDVAEHPEYGRPVGHPGARSFIGVPLRDRNHVLLGVVAAVTHEPRRWTEHERQFLEGLAEIAIDELESAVLQREAVHTRTLLATVLDDAHVQFALFDADMHFLMVNQSVADDHGLDPAAFIGRRIDDVIPDISPEYEKMVNEVIETGVSVANDHVVTHRRSHYGPHRVFATNCFRLTDDGQHRAVIIADDITDQVMVTERAEQLATIGERLNLDAGLEQLRHVVGNQLRDFFYADEAELSLWPTTSPQQFVDGATSAAAAAADTLEVTLVAHPSTIADPDADDGGGGGGRRAFAEAVVPCLSGSSALSGLLTLRWHHGIGADEFQEAELRSIGTLLGAVIERERLTIERTELLDELRSALLTQPVRRPGLDPAVRYRPALNSAGFGGDWYDLVALDAHRTALLVGDVVGHGPAAAAAMSQVSATIAQLLVRGVELTEVFAEAELVLRARAIDTMATVAIVVVDVVARTLTAVCAGHPPSVVITPDGRSSLLRPPSRPPLCSFPAASESLTTPYEPGTRLILYTDGLIERRSDDLATSLDQLLAAAEAHADETIDRLVDSLVAELHPETDDLAMLGAVLTPVDTVERR